MSVEDKLKEIEELKQKQKSFEDQKAKALKEMEQRFNELDYVPEEDIRKILDIDARVTYTKNRIWQNTQDIISLQKKQRDILFAKTAEKRRKEQDAAINILLDTIKKVKSSQDPPEKKFFILSETQEKIRAQEEYLKTVKNRTWSEFEYLLKQFKPVTTAVQIGTGKTVMIKAAQKYFGIDRTEIINWLKGKGKQVQTEQELKDAALKMIVELAKE